MEVLEPLTGMAIEAACPFLRPAHANGIHRIAGYCEAVPDGLMIPSSEEYRKWCSTAAHIACPIHRARRAESLWRHAAA